MLKSVSMEATVGESRNFDVVNDYPDLTLVLDWETVVVLTAIYSARYWVHFSLALYCNITFYTEGYMQNYICINASRQ